MFTRSRAGTHRGSIAESRRTARWTSELRAEVVSVWAVEEESLEFERALSVGLIELAEHVERYAFFPFQCADFFEVELVGVVHRV